MSTSSFTAAQVSSLFGIAGYQVDDLSGYFDIMGEQPAPAGAEGFQVGYGVSLSQEGGMVNHVLGKRVGEVVEGEGEGEGEVTKRQRLSPTSSWENSGWGNEAAAAAGGGKGVGGRRLWVKERDHQWWDMVSSPEYPEEEFKRAFRMSRATFAMVCEALGAAVAKEDTMLRAAIPVPQRVAVCIWRLATGEPLRQVSKRFGLGISTCHKLVLEVSAAIKTLLMPKFVVWPGDEAAQAAVSAGFEAASGISGVIGAVYTTHIPIIAPKLNITAFYNRLHTERNQKTSYSTTMQCVVDSTGCFTDVCIGWPGSHPDEEVLSRSSLCNKRAAQMAPGQWIVGAGTFPLMDWLLVPYGHQNLTWGQHVFNEKIAAVNAVSRDAFRRLKARWACLQKRTEVKLQDLPIVLGACCVLHNICERYGDTVDPELDFQLVDDDVAPLNPVRSSAAAQARDAIAHNLLHQRAAIL